MSQPITIDGGQTAVTIKHHSSQIITIDSDSGSPFKSLVVKNDDGKVLFTAPEQGPGNIMWHVEIK
jgi:hypothetical protein